MDSYMKYKECCACLSSKLLKVRGEYTAVISTVGSCRTGKSYLLEKVTKFLGGSSSFPSADGYDRVTLSVGISDPICIGRRNDRNVNVIFVDTPGLFRIDATNREDALVFAFAYSVSDFLLWNEKEDVANENLSFLHSCLEFNKLMSFRTNSKVSERETPIPRYPNLLICMRDMADEINSTFDLGSCDDSHESDFLTKRIFASEERHEQQNELRNHFLSNFSATTAFLFPRPKEKELMNHYTSTSTNSFGKLMSNFADKITEMIISGERLQTSECLQQRIDSFVNCLQMSSHIDFPTKLELVEAVQTGRLKMNARKNFESILSEKLDQHDLELTDKNVQEYLETSLRIITECKFIPNNLKEKAVEEMRAEFSQMLQQFPYNTATKTSAGTKEHNKGRLQSETSTASYSSLDSEESEVCYQTRSSITDLHPPPIQVAK